MLPKNYELVYKELLSKLKNVDFERVVKDKGGRLISPREIEMPMLNRTYVVREDGVFTGGVEEKDFKKKIVLLYYILGDGFVPLSNEWVSYRDFKNARNFYAYFKNYVENPIARSFKGRVKSLELASQNLGGRKENIGSGDLSVVFNLLPKVPLLLIFWDGDEELDAGCVILFDRNSIDYLDEECLAVSGWILAEELIKNGGEPK